MQHQGLLDRLSALYREYATVDPDQIEEIPRAVSTRKYFRIFHGGESVVGTYSPDTKETNAFTTFASQFREAGVSVPEIYHISNDQQFYLQEDLGNTTLHDLITNHTSAAFSDHIIKLYEFAIEELIKIQVDGDRLVDYHLSVPVPSFEYQSILWDLYHFKYYFLKPSGMPFDEQQLEQGFQQFAKALNNIEPKGFMFRDFQSRNVMLKNDKPYLIDFQGGRKGPLLYDIASLVYEAKAGLSEDTRNMFVTMYLKSLERQGVHTGSNVMDDFYLLALVRVLQALGAYGLRGNVEKKAVFIQSIPAGLLNLEHILEKLDHSSLQPYLRDVLTHLCMERSRYPKQAVSFSGLTITVYSFSYRNPIPDDLEGNGGGFVYDCRFLENPGKYDNLKLFTGLQKPVAEFLSIRGEVLDYIDSIKKQLAAVIHTYKDRDYKNLMVSFGCTGGRHRSVFMAHSIATWLRDIPGLRIIEIHREIDK